MFKSENINELSKAVCDFQKEYEQVKYDATVKVTTKSGSSYSFEYATLSNIIETLRPIYTKHGLSIVQTMDENIIETSLLHISGQFITSRFKLNIEGQKTQQEIGAIISYNRRYAINMILGIVADEDDDANVADNNQFTKSSIGKSKEPKATEKQVVPPELIKMLETADSEENLNAIMVKYKGFWNNEIFKRIVKHRREQLNKKK
jgi:hypothetical protein